MSRKSRNIFGETIPELFLLQRKNSKTFFDMSWSTEEGRTCCKKKEKKRKLHSLTSPPPPFQGSSFIFVWYWNFMTWLSCSNAVEVVAFHFLRKLAGCSWEEWSRNEVLFEAPKYCCFNSQLQPGSAKISTGCNFAGWRVVLNFRFGIEPTMLNTVLSNWAHADYILSQHCQCQQWTNFYSAAEKIEKEGWIEGFELKRKGPIHFRRAL